MEWNGTIYVIDCIIVVLLELARSWPDKPAEEVEAESNLEFQFALFKEEQSDLDFS